MPLTEKIKKTLFVYYGIEDNKLFIQFADEDSVVAYEVREKINDRRIRAITDMMGVFLASEEFKKADVREPYGHIEHVNGKMISPITGEVVYTEELPEEMVETLEYTIFLALRENNK